MHTKNYIFLFSIITVATIYFFYEKHQSDKFDFAVPRACVEKIPDYDFPNSKFDNDRSKDISILMSSLGNYIPIKNRSNLCFLKSKEKSDGMLHCYAVFSEVDEEGVKICFAPRGGFVSYEYDM
jgi:hypothetical protein